MDKDRFYASARGDVAGPLDGVRVLDVTTAWAGPMAACLLADLGADVVKVELPGNRAGQMPPLIPGTGRSWFRETLDRNKRSVALDLRRPDGISALVELARDADVLIENFRPGTLAGWGAGWERCRQVNPGLVYVSISAWGQFGPEAQRPGYDPIVQAWSGWMSLNGDPTGAPVKAPTFLADDLAALHAVIGALAALRHRDVHGEGQHVDVSLLDALLYQSNGYLALAAAGAPLERWGNETEMLVPSALYHCRDGDVHVVVALDRQWRALAGAMGRDDLARAPGFATVGQRRANRAAVHDVVAGWCAARDVTEVVAALHAASVSVAPVRTFHAAAADGHVRERDMLQRVELADGSMAMLTGPAVKFSRTPVAVRHAAPVPGAHTDELLGPRAGARE